MEKPITEYRKSTGTPASTFAARIGVDRITLWRWENGRVPAERAVQIEREFGIPRATLRPDLFGSDK